MNPLSSLSLTARPEFHTELLAARPGEGAASQSVPARELEKLGAPGETAPAGASGPAADSFSNVLGQMVREVSAKQTAAGDTVNGLLSGQGASLHQAMIAMEEASVSFQLMVEVRNKLLDSYQELMRMQV